MKNATDKARLVYELDIELPDQKNVMNFLTTLMAKAIVLENPGGVRVSAPSGYGKSFLISKIRELHPATVENGQTQMPVLSIDFEQDPTVDTVSVMLLEALQFPFANKQAETERKDLTVDAIRESRVRLIIFDETNYLCTGHRQISSNKVCGYLRDIYDATNVPFAFFGTEELEKAFKWYPPLGQRCSATLPQAGLSEGPGLIKVLEEYDRRMPFKERSGLAEGDIPARFATAIEGSHRSLKTILRTAALMAAIDGSEKLELKHLSQGFVQWAGSRANPFK